MHAAIDFKPRVWKLNGNKHECPIEFEIQVH